MRKTSVWLALLCVAVIALMAAKTLLVEVPPVRAHSVAGEFDAQRAKARLAFILGDQRPHPADTPADDQVRDRIVALLQGMGLKPIVRDQLACNELFKARGVSCARVHNVIAVLGPRAGKAVLLNAHYDSVPMGPGASDDGMGVATLLEVGALLKDRPLKRPVILLFNEGEELGLVGARAFLADPLSRNVGSLVNLEARGVRGPVNMFETSRPNGAPIALFASAVKHPVANSLSTDVYRLLPNYTDVNSFSERGWLTLNLAPIGNETRYHSPGDDLAALDPATLQHMGDQTLALTQALANGTPRASGGDRIFMDVAGRMLITLPMAVGVVLLIGLLIGFAALAWTRGGLIRGVAVVLGTLVGSTALSWLALALIGAARHGMFWRAYPLWTHLATYASVMLVTVALLATLGRRVDLRKLRAAFWLTYVFIGALIGLVAPGGIIFFLFPPLLALIGMVASRWWPSAERIGALAAVVLLYLTWGAMLGLLEELLNGGPMWIFAPLGALLIVPILIEAKPLVDAVNVRTVTATAGVLALAGWACAAAAPAYSADREQRFVIEHITDLRTFKSFWSVLNDGPPLPYAFQAAAHWSRGKLPFSDRPRWIAAAPADTSFLAAPGVQRVSEVRNGNERTLTLRFVATGFDHIQLIGPEDARIHSAGAPGFMRPIDSVGEIGKYDIDCFGRSCDGAALELTIGRPDPVEFIVVGSHAGLPASAAPLLSAHPKFARPQYNRDETIAFARTSL
ncbi:MAG TPA: M20/M25/M40 family metallo-hydrolase [Sphingomicrobium sp.]|nr:M20/M25/M40 family metallo-hydrolase [Sphingomicrobium sp.]